MDFIILPQYFTLYHLFIQDVSLTHKYIICLRGFWRLESYLYNRFLGNTYVKSSPHLQYIILIPFLLKSVHFNIGSCDI